MKNDVLAWKDEPASQKEGGGTGVDAETLLGKVESILAGGFGLDRVAIRSGLQEEQIRDLLHRTNRGALPERQVMGGVDHRQLEQLQALKRWLDEYEKGQQDGREVFADAPTARHIMGIARKAISDKEMIMLIGLSGMGKSYALRKVATDYPMTLDRPGAAFIPVVSMDKGPSIYKKVDLAIGMKETAVSRANSLYRTVPSQLRKGDLLIFDEGNNLFEGAAGWRAVQDIYDNSDASVIINCNPFAIDLVSAEGARINAFMNRCRRFLFLEGNCEEDAEKFMAARGYTGEALMRAAAAIATRTDGTGGLRGLAAALDDAHAIAQAKGEKVTAPLLIRSHRAAYMWVQSKSTKGGRK